MKKVKRSLQILALLIIGVVLFRAWIFRKSISYTPIGKRSIIWLTDKALLQELEDEIEFKLTSKTKNRRLNLDQIIQLAQRKTSQKLYFSSEKCAANPNILIKERKSNCVGYAAFFGSVVQFILQSQGLKEQYQVHHLVGNIDLWGVNLHQFSNNSFFKDHDYNKITNLKTGHTIYIDPIVSAYLRIHQVSPKSNR